MTRERIGLVVVVLTLLFCCVAAQESISTVDKVNIAVLSPVQTTLTVVESASQDPNSISVSVSAGFGYYVNDSFTGILGIIIFSNSTTTSSSSAASGLAPGKGFLIPFLLCLLLLITRIRGFVFGSAVLFLICSLAFATAATPSEVVVTITVPPAATLNCLVLAVSNTTGSTVNCSAVENLNCQVATSPDVLQQTCACFKKAVSTADISVSSNPSTFDSSGNAVSCTYNQFGTIHAEVTNTDATASCFDINFEFKSQSSLFDFGSIINVTSTVPDQFEVFKGFYTVSCEAIFDAGQTYQFAFAYQFTSCCADQTGTLLTGDVYPDGSTTPIASSLVNVTIIDECV